MWPWFVQSGRDASTAFSMTEIVLLTRGDFSYDAGREEDLGYAGRVAAFD
jgi:hypothetical protein